MAILLDIPVLYSNSHNNGHMKSRQTIYIMIYGYTIESVLDNYM